MASVVEICNIGLLRLGAKTITSITESTREAVSFNAAYNPRRLALLRKYRWNFAIVRAQLAADATKPLFGRANAFTWPTDCLRIIPPDPELNLNDLDWEIEGRKIITNGSAPLNIRYISDVTDPNLMDPIFRQVLGYDLAEFLCEKITQSNTKQASITEDKKNLLSEARLTNMIERPASDPPIDSWITKRL